jgi:hypothetical protein
LIFQKHGRRIPLRVSFYICELKKAARISFDAIFYRFNVLLVLDAVERFKITPQFPKIRACCIKLMLLVPIHGANALTRN